MRARLLVIVLTLVILVLAPGSQGVAQAPLDPQTLIGEWVGKWTGTTSPGHGRHGGREGPYSLTINRVEGDRVFATVDFQGTRRIRATLSGTNLAFGNEQFQTALRIDGDQMRGTVTGGGIPPREITLTKKR